MFNTKRSLTLNLANHTHSIYIQPFCQELEQLQVTPSLFQKPIFHIFESFSASK
jgi:hypothetical protein